jgi:hypothetical protein
LCKLAASMHYETCLPQCDTVGPECT